MPMPSKATAVYEQIKQDVIRLRFRRDEIINEKALAERYQVSKTPVREALASALSGREALVSVLTSQVISNVPAALLLSGFSSQWRGLIIGCNLGGLGTLIASMASLISYKQVAREHPEQLRRYFLWFTISNVCLLALLFLFYVIFEGGM